MQPVNPRQKTRQIGPFCPLDAATLLSFQADNDQAAQPMMPSTNVVGNRPASSRLQMPLSR